MSGDGRSSRSAHSGAGTPEGFARSADSRQSPAVLDRLRALRQGDAPTHGGHVLAYVYDSGVDDLDDLADAAAQLARPLNGLDPTVFPSVAAMERDLIGFVRSALHGGRDVVGSVTSGGTESCLLSVKTARDLWRRDHPASSAAGQRRDAVADVATDAQRGIRPRLVAPATAHAAFQKAARLFDLEWDPVPCRPDGSVAASDLIAKLGDDVALVVVSAPAYPSGALDPVREIAAAARSRGISCHVDACFGGLVLPWWPGVAAWDFRVPGVTSISADLHKFGYAPKGVSVLLHRGRRRHRAQFFATTRWPGYPVVNPTLLGSKSASPLAAAWAIVQHLGADRYADLVASVARVAAQIRARVASIPGLIVWGEPTGPAIALIADPSVPAAQRVDPHRLADTMLARGWRIQHQPGFVQTDGTRLPRSVHLTLTPVLERTLPQFSAALVEASDAVRGQPPADARALLVAMRALGYAGAHARVPSPRAAWRLLRLAGAADVGGAQPMAMLMAVIEGVPAPVAEALLTELLARLSEPR